jgi:hypothetical protein
MPRRKETLKRGSQIVVRKAISEKSCDHPQAQDNGDVVLEQCGLGSPSSKSGRNRCRHSGVHAVSIRQPHERTAGNQTVLDSNSSKFKKSFETNLLSYTHFYRLRDKIKQGLHGCATNLHARTRSQPSRVRPARAKAALKPQTAFYHDPNVQAPRATVCHTCRAIGCNGR